MRKMLRNSLPILLTIVAACSDNGGPNMQGDGGGTGDGDGGQTGDGDGGGGGPDGGGPDAIPATTVCAGGTADFATIQDAVDAAANGDRLALCAGTYQEHVTINGKTLTIEGDGAIIDGDNSFGISVTGGADVTINGVDFNDGRNAVKCEGSTLVLENGTISGASATEGGGLHSDNCTLTVRDMTFEMNHGVDGGGMWVTGGTFEVTGTTFANNTGSNGAGAYIVAAAGTMDDVEFLNNSVTNKGGALHVRDAGPTFTNITVKGSSSGEDGGGVYNTNSTAIYRDCLIEDNESTNDDAGGMRVHVSMITVERCTFRNNKSRSSGGAVKMSHAKSTWIDNVFENNTADGVGGALEVDDDQSLIKGCEFRGNKGSRGGAIHGALIGGSEGWEDLIIENNEAETSGGGIMLELNEGFVPMKRIVLDGNTAERGGNFYASGTAFSMEASLVVNGTAEASGGGIALGTGATGEFDFVTVDGNTASSGAALRVREASATIRNSIFIGNVFGEMASIDWSYTNTQGSFSGTSQPSGSGNMSVNPGFVSDSDWHLTSSSPLKDAADPALMDRDGSAADMGAYGGPEGM